MVVSVHKRRLRVLDTFSSVTSGTVSKRHDGLFSAEWKRARPDAGTHRHPSETQVLALAARKTGPQS